jgi:hypothetical protein
MTSAATLGINRQGSQEEHERRNEERSMHMFIICRLEPGDSEIRTLMRGIRTVPRTGDRPVFA